MRYWCKEFLIYLLDVRFVTGSASYVHFIAAFHKNINIVYRSQNCHRRQSGLENSCSPLLLIFYRCPEYWKERLQRERKQQLKLAKQCYDEQLEVLLGLRNSMISF